MALVALYYINVQGRLRQITKWAALSALFWRRLRDPGYCSLLLTFGSYGVSNFERLRGRIIFYFTYFLKTKVSRHSFPFLIFCTLQHHQKPDHDLPDPKCQFVPLDGDQYHLLISETTRSPISKHMFFLYPSKHEWQEAGIISISSLFSGKVYFLRK